MPSTFNCLRCKRLMTIDNIQKSDGLCDSCDDFDPSCGAASATIDPPGTHNMGMGSLKKHTFKSMLEIAQFFKVQAEKCDKQIEQTQIMNRLTVERDTWLKAGEFLLDSEIIIKE